MIKVSKLADYAVVILATLAEDKAGLMTASHIATKTGLPEPTVAKVLKMLARTDLLDSIRGVHGGYRLNGSAEDISVADIVKAVDGPISLTACVEGNKEPCSYQGMCRVKGRWDTVNLAISEALENVTLASMIMPARTPLLKRPAYAEKIEERL